MTTATPARAGAASDGESLVRTYFADLDRTRADAVTVGRYCAEDIRVHLPGTPALDRAAFTGFGQAFYAGFPDLGHTIEEAVAAGDRVAVRLRIRGTHRGTFQEVAPTGRRADFTAMSMARLRDGKIAEMWIEGDFLGLMQQLGALPGAAAPAR